MTQSETIQAYILDWFYSHQHIVITKAMLLKLDAFKSFDRNTLLLEIALLKQKGRLVSNILSHGPHANEVISIASTYRKAA